MEQKKIYPYLIDTKRMTGYYEILMDEGFKFQIFNKTKNKDIYEYFLPLVRKYMFWTFELEQVEEFKKLGNDMKAAICGGYQCNIFEKGESQVICFNSGVCFALTKDLKLVKKLTKYQETIKMQEINLREDINYNIQKDEISTYVYVLALYKLFNLKKMTIEIKNPILFNQIRNDYVEFIQDLYNLDVSDKKNDSAKWEKELEIEKEQILLDNEFNLLYKNNKLNDNQTIARISIGLCIVVIIIGIIILTNSMIS